MKGDPTFVILKYSAWLDTHQFEDKILGAVVRYPLRPTNEYAPASPLRYNDTELVEGVFTDFLHDSTHAVAHDASAARRRASTCAASGCATSGCSNMRGSGRGSGRTTPSATRSPAGSRCSTRGRRASSWAS